MKESGRMLICNWLHESPGFCAAAAEREPVISAPATAERQVVRNISMSNMQAQTHLGRIGLIYLFLFIPLC